MPNADDLVAFHADAGRDGWGHMIEDVWALGLDELEASHDYNHNFLRQTRILKSLTLLGLQPLARAWLECLSMVYRASAEVVGHETFEYWRAAVR